MAEKCVKNKSKHYPEWCWHFRSDYAWLRRHQLLLQQNNTIAEVCRPKKSTKYHYFYDEIFFAKAKYKTVMMPFVWMPERSKVTPFICITTINQITKRKLIFICMFYSIVSLSLFCFYSKFETLWERFCLVHSFGFWKNWCWHNQINTENGTKQKKINDRISSNVKRQLFICEHLFEIRIKWLFLLPLHAFGILQCFVKFETGPHFIEAEKCFICIVAYHFRIAINFVFSRSRPHPRSLAKLPHEY